MSAEKIKKERVSKEVIEAENIAWARFLIKQYKKKKLKESLSISEESVE